MLRSTADQGGNSEKIWKFGFSRNPNVKIVSFILTISVAISLKLVFSKRVIFAFEKRYFENDLAN